MKPKKLIYALLLTYCLLATACIACIIVFWGGFLDEQNKNCRADALAIELPLYPASVQVYEEETADADGAEGKLTRGYTSEAAFADVVSFYETHEAGITCTRFTDPSRALCLLDDDLSLAAYRVEIKVGEEQTLYQTVVEWKCAGLD
ncbi:MAG: hypothetical protein JXA10_18920 [Anaerolineae bacterium]|nr:hypothetical protein [Anaerolineae bacterium]